MFLLIYGGDGDRLSEELRNYYTYRATACYEYDFMGRIDDMVETLGIHLGSANMTASLSMRLKRAIYRETKDILIREARADINLVTARWDELNLHHIVIIRNIPQDMNLALFPSYKIFMMKEESHFENSDLHDCAVSNNFDLVVDTLTHDPREVAALIGESLHRKMISAFTKPQDNDKTVP